MLIEIPDIESYVAAKAEYDAAVLQEARAQEEHRLEKEAWAKLPKEEKKGKSGPKKPAKKSLVAPVAKNKVLCVCDYTYQVCTNYVSAAPSGKIPELCAGQFVSADALIACFRERCIPVDGGAKVTQAKIKAASDFLIQHGFDLMGETKAHREVVANVGIEPSHAKFKQQEKSRVVTKVQGFVSEPASFFPVSGAQPVALTVKRDAIWETVKARIGAQGFYSIVDEVIEPGKQLEEGEEHETMRFVRFSQDLQKKGYEHSGLDSRYPLNQAIAADETLFALGNVLYVPFEYPSKKAGKKRPASSPAGKAPAAKKEKQGEKSTAGAGDSASPQSA